MKIPEIQVDQSAQTGTTGARATPEDFGESQVQGMQQFAQGVDALGRGATQLNQAFLLKERISKDRDDGTWATNNVFQLQKDLNDWKADPNNFTDEKFADNFQKFALEKIDGLQQDAPSPEAYNRFRMHALAFTSHSYEQALSTAEATKTSNAISAIDGQISDALECYKTGSQTPGSTPDVDFEVGAGVIKDNIDQMFGKVAPQTAQKLKEHLVTQMALGVMDSNPTLARKMLESMPIDQRLHHTLTREIDQVEASQKMVEADSFRRHVDDNLTQLDSGKSADQLTLQDFQSALPKAHAEIAFQNYQDQVGVIQSKNGYLQEHGGEAPEFQSNVLRDMHDNINTDLDRKKYDAVLRAATLNNQQLQKDRVQWIRDNQPEVKHLQQLASDSSDQDRVRALSEFNSAILKYQGPPPPEATEDEAKHYLNLPMNDRHILTSSEAETYANQINSATPTQAVKTIDQVMARYPDEKHQYFAFNDMVTMPGPRGIKQEYQLAFQNRGAYWLDSYTGAIGQGDAIKKLTDTKSKEAITGNIDKNPTWLQFQHAMIGANVDRAKEIEGFKNGISTFAQEMVLRGSSPEAATSQAVKNLLTSTLGFTSVNGQTLVIPRDRGYDKTYNGPRQPDRTDDEVYGIGKSLNYMLQTIDPRQVNLDNFPILKALPGEPDKVERMDLMRNQILRRGYFQAGPDGQSAHLYMLDDSGHPFELTDKNSRPFVANLNQLPDYQSHVGYDDIAHGLQSDQMEQFTGNVDKGVVPLTEHKNAYGTRWLYGDQVKTNWPTMEGWIIGDPTGHGMLANPAQRPPKDARAQRRH